MLTVRVENLSNSTDSAATRALFETYGDIASLRLERTGLVRRYDGVALVEMDTSAARNAIAALDGRVFNGAILTVKEAIEPRAAAVEPASKKASGAQGGAKALAHRRAEVKEIKKVAGPGGVKGDDWYRYVLQRGESKITGFHRGSLQDVTEYANECAEAMDGRKQRGRYSTVPAQPRKK